MRCPFCKNPHAMSITHRLELPPDDRSDEVTLQLIRCSACKAEAGAIYEESRRGASESWHHFAFEMDPFSRLRILRLMEGCPDPGNKRCQCQAHLDLAGPAAYRLVTKQVPI